MGGFGPSRKACTSQANGHIDYNHTPQAFDDLWGSCSKYLSGLEPVLALLEGTLMMTSSFVNREIPTGLHVLTPVPKCGDRFLQTERTEPFGLKAHKIKHFVDFRVEKD